MEKKENTGTKLNVLLCNLVDYVRGDDRPLVFAVMQEITEYFEQELDKAREEGRREQAELDRALYSVSFEHIKNADFEKILLESVKKAREEGYKKGYIDGQIEKINKPKPVVSEFDKTSYLN